MAKFGIDVCSYQGTINWVSVKKAGCGFAVLKCIMKDFRTDSKFDSNVKGCEKNKIPISVYTYVYENTKESAVKRAKAVIATIKKYSSLDGCTVWWDVEDKSIRKTGVENRAKLTDSIIAARAVIKDAGYNFGVYCDTDFYISCLNANAIGGKWWLAKYGKNTVTAFGKKPTDKKPIIANELCGWQYCSRGIVPGISGNVDLDIAYDDDFIRGSSLNYLGDLETIRLGDCGQLVKVLQKLLDIKVTGEFDSITRICVEAYQRNSGLNADGIVGKKTWSKLLS